MHIEGQISQVKTHWFSYNKGNGFWIEKTTEFGEWRPLMASLSKPQDTVLVNHSSQVQSSIVCLVEIFLQFPLSSQKHFVRWASLPAVCTIPCCGLVSQASELPQSWPALPTSDVLLIHGFVFPPFLTAIHSVNKVYIFKTIWYIVQLEKEA